MKYLVKVEFINGHQEEFITADNIKDPKRTILLDNCEFFHSREGHVINLQKLKRIKIKRFKKKCQECLGAIGSFIDDGLVFCDTCMRQRTIAMKK